MRYAKLSVAMCADNGELFLREQLDSIAAQTRLPDELVVFEELFLHLSEMGIYLCQDMHRSYDPCFRGGYLSPGSFTEYAKGLVDQLNAWHCRKKKGWFRGHKRWHRHWKACRDYDYSYHRPHYYYDPYPYSHGYGAPFISFEFGKQPHPHHHYWDDDWDW